MAGLILNGMGTTTKSPVSYDPATRSVDADQTVLGRVTKTVAADSPLITQARTSAAQGMNARGLQNSSMALGEGEKAAYSVALPIAQQDAATYGQAASENMAAKNRGFEFTASAENQRQAQELAGTQALEQIGASGAETRKNIEAQGTQSLAQIGAQGSETRQTQAQAGTIQSQLSAQQSVQQQALAQLQGEIQSGLITTQEQANARLAEIQGQIQSQLSAQGAEQASALSAQQAQQQSAQIAQQLAGDMQLQGLRGDQAQQIAQIEAQNRTLIQASTDAARFFSQISASLSDILAQPDIAVDQKQQLVDKQVQLLQSGLAVIGGVSGMDFSSLLDFSGSVTSGAQPIEATVYPDTGQTDMKGSIVGPNGSIYGPNGETNGKWVQGRGGIYWQTNG